MDVEETAKKPKAVKLEVADSLPPGVGLQEKWNITTAPSVISSIQFNLQRLQMALPGGTGTRKAIRERARMNVP